MSKKRRVLVVEDNTGNAFVVENFLEKLGAEVEIACDGMEGFKTWANGVFDLVLMDLSMPVMDGYGATSQIRSEEKKTGRARCPVVALTAHADEEVEKSCLDADMDACYVKPISFAQMKELLARFT